MDQKDPSELFDLVRDVTDALTVRRILTTLFFGLMVTVLVVLFEQRETLFKRVYSAIAQQQQEWTLSGETKSQLIRAVDSSRIISFALVSEVDLQKNRRVARFWHTSSPLQTASLNKIRGLLPQPVFDFDPNNTAQMVNVLNNEFVCSRYQDTVFYKLLPELSNTYPTICRLAVPPFYGRFVGILTIGLNTIPSQSDVDALRLEMARIAVEIYLRDVIKKPMDK